MMGHFIETQFSFGFNWPMGSAMSFTLLAASLALVISLPDAAAAAAPAMKASAIATAAWSAFIAAVVTFMLLPLALVIVFSFNAAALTSFPLTGFTLDWYAQALRQ